MALLSTVRATGRGAFGLVKDFQQEWSRARVGGLAAEIAFFGLLGLFPAVLVFAATLGSWDALVGVEAASEAEEWVLERVSETFGDDNTISDTVRDLFDQPNAGLLTVGVLLTLYAASRGFTALVGALNVVYGHERRRNWVSTRLTGVVLTLLSIAVATLIAAILVTGPLFGLGAAIADRAEMGDTFVSFWALLRWPVAGLVTMLWMATTYNYAPLSRTPWRSDVAGAAVAALWWLVISLGFRTYVEAASSGVNAVFGLLGGALTLIVWLYLMSMGLVVGAVVNSVLHRSGSTEPPSVDEAEPADAG